MKSLQCVVIRPSSGTHIVKKTFTVGDTEIRYGKDFVRKNPRKLVYVPVESGLSLKQKDKIFREVLETERRKLQLSLEGRRLKRERSGQS